METVSGLLPRRRRPAAFLFGHPHWPVSKAPCLGYKNSYDRRVIVQLLRFIHKQGSIGAAEKRPSAALRCKPHRSTYFYIRFTLRFLRALQPAVFEQPTQNRVFQQTHPSGVFVVQDRVPSYATTRKPSMGIGCALICRVRMVSKHPLPATHMPGEGVYRVCYGSLFCPWPNAPAFSMIPPGSSMSVGSPFSCPPTISLSSPVTCRIS